MKVDNIISYHLREIMNTVIFEYPDVQNRNVLRNTKDK